MEIVSQTVAAMQAVFGENLDGLARASGCVLRQRKFSGMSLLRTLVLSLLHCPAAKNRDYRDTAARLGVFVSEEAIEGRFTDGLVKFLSEALKIAVSQTLAAKPLPATLAEAYWISRLQHNTKVFDACGTQLSLLHFLKQQGENGLLDMPILLGEKERLPCRMIAIRVPPEVAARRRQQAREKALKHGREPSQEYLAILEWTIFVTNCPVELLSWKEVVVLYRARWQIELLFKLWKSHNRLEQRERHASPQRQMAVLYAKLIGVIVQHWILLTATWNDGQRSLRKAAAVVQSWILLFSEVLDDVSRLDDLLRRLQAAIAHAARITRRKKHPSLFQFLENPELLDYTIP